MTLSKQTVKDFKQYIASSGKRCPNCKMISKVRRIEINCRLIVDPKPVSTLLGTAYYWCDSCEHHFAGDFRP